jgi:hypothetical protein
MNVTVGQTIKYTGRTAEVTKLTRTRVWLKIAHVTFIVARENLKPVYGLASA